MFIMEFIFILTGLAVLFLVLNRRATSSHPQSDPANNAQQTTWQADLHFETALMRLQDRIEQDKLTLRHTKGMLPMAIAQSKEHLHELERNLAWLQRVRRMYRNLLEQYEGDTKHLKKLLDDWRKFTDAIWARSNTDEWQELYAEHGLEIEGDLYEKSKLYGERAEKVANHLFDQAPNTQ